jgi:hypothetical protein
MAVEEWDRSQSQMGSYALDDMVGDIPFPGSYQSPDVLAKALLTSINHAIMGDTDNSQHGLTAEDLLSVVYDDSKKVFVFECGPKGARVELTMERHLALMFGFDYPDDHTTISFAPVPSRATGVHVSDADKEWSRTGQVIILAPNKGIEGPIPVAVESTYPVTPSLGTENMHIHTNIIGDAATIIDGERMNCLAIVPIGWNKNGSLHSPNVPTAKPLNTNVISEIRIEVKDSRGEYIRFMGNDNLPVTVTLLLSRKQ